MPRALAVIVASALLSGSASAIDLHQLWDGRCLECHGHASDFARRHLAVRDGRLVGRHQDRDLRQFLALHEAGAAQAGALHDMLLALARTPPIYRTRCAGCHDNAAALARASLSLRNATVVARESGRPVAELLRSHGKLDPAEIPIVVESLARVLREVSGGQAKDIPNDR